MHPWLRFGGAIHWRKLPSWKLGQHTRKKEDWEINTPMWSLPSYPLPNAKFFSQEILRIAVAFDNLRYFCLCERRITRAHYLRSKVWQGAKPRRRFTWPSSHESNSWKLSRLHFLVVPMTAQKPLNQFLLPYVLYAIKYIINVQIHLMYNFKMCTLAQQLASRMNEPSHYPWVASSGSLKQRSVASRVYILDRPVHSKAGKLVLIAVKGINRVECVRMLPSSTFAPLKKRRRKKGV